MRRWQAFSMGPWRWGIILLVVASIPMRIHSLDRSLWLDETWVANSVLEPDLASVFYYEPWLQTTPPLFLLLERLVVNVFPIGNATFRLLPCLFGILGVGAMAYLAQRLLRPPTAFLVLLLFVFSPGHVIYSQTLKQYTGDVLVSIVLMGIGLAYLQYRTSRLLLASIGVFAALASLSYNAVLFMPALLYGALFDAPASSKRLPVWHPRWAHALAVVGAVAAAALVNYFVFIEPNLNENILGPSAEGRIHTHTWIAHYASKSLDLLRLFKHFFFNMSVPWSGSWLAALMVGAALIALVGVLHLCARGGKGVPRNLDKAAVLTLPIAGGFALHLAGYYPLDEERLNLFLLPNTLILFGIGLQALVVRARLLSRRRRIVPPPWLPSRPYAAICMGLVTILVIRIVVGVPTAPYFAWHSASHEDTGAAVAYLGSVAGPRTVVYVDASMLEPVKLYARLMPIDEARLVQGRLGWPCCPRNVMLDRQARPEQALPPEVDRIFENGAGDTLWMLYTDRAYHWKAAGANYPELFDQRLRERGCHPADSPDFEGVLLKRYHCPRGDADAAVVGPKAAPATAMPRTGAAAQSTAWRSGAGSRAG